MVDTEELAAPGEESADRDRHSVKVDSLGYAGRFVEAERIQVVDASLTVTCFGHDVFGSVTTWLRGHTSDSLACGVNPINEPWVQEAYRLRCGPLSR
ncbi:hypothetical protein OHB54_29805 [Streptomyces sp. NBC_01007]|nr:hypothetical protein OHB54_29805 [Streptomyces sp. NBC_01007]